MAQGKSIYIHRFSVQARKADLVKTLNDAEVENLATVDDQRRYYEVWLGSVNALR